MSEQKGFHHINFSRLKDLATFPGLPEQLKEISYVANATNFRRVIMNRYGKDDIDIDHEIATNPDTKLTYLGYRRFLESDLQYIFPVGEGRTNNGYKRDVKYLAKQMLIRGYVSRGSYFTIMPSLRNALANQRDPRLSQARAKAHFQIICAFPYTSLSESTRSP